MLAGDAGLVDDDQPGFLTFHAVPSILIVVIIVIVFSTRSLSRIGWLDIMTSSRGEYCSPIGKDRPCRYISRTGTDLLKLKIG